MTSCHGAPARAEGPADLTIALAGNPNVGKSSIFNRLTNSRAETANYPGKTVAVASGSCEWRGTRVVLLDLPGTYGILPASEDQKVARDALVDDPPDAVIVVVDSTNLARNLYLVLSVLDLGLPVVIAANLLDEAEKKGLFLDAHRLTERLDATVVPTVATRSQGLHDLVPAAARSVREGVLERPWYGEALERDIASVGATIPADAIPKGLPPRAAALLLLEGDARMEAAVRGTALAAHAGRLSEPVARARHALAADLARECLRSARTEPRFADRLWDRVTSPVVGMGVLVAILLSIFGFVYFVGGFLATAFTDAWAAIASPAIQGALGTVAGDSVLARILGWGLDAGIGAALAVGIPYVLTFYLVLAFLEDSGYLNAAAFLSDRAMHRFGLHGRAVIPLVAGLGCNVPAIMGTRVLGTRRERLLAAALITLVPCSARTAVIFGAVGFFVGLLPALAVFAVQLGVVAAAGVLLNRIVPGRSTGLVMEVFPLRRPTFADVARKTWWRFRSYVTMALPIVVAGSLVLGALYETGTMWALSDPLAPVVSGWLGLPAVAGLALVFAVLRKELALQLLVALAAVQVGAGAASLSTFMTPVQLVVFALVTAIYVPCVATVAALARELNAKAAFLISAFTVGLALLVGGVAFRILTLG
ncbi:MAG: ferrous iron transport protein B [Euryarchaeota archaeon RBG_16_68_13]|nr:MAG: ferrous iron transport protein B [Euryarchaeota archaeon RBG_16_68_13]